MPVRGSVYEKINPKGYQQITDCSTAVGLTIPARANLAIIQAQTNSVRYRDDGTDPTGTVGMVIATDTAITYTGKLSAIKFINTIAGASTLNVSYYEI